MTDATESVDKVIDRDALASYLDTHLEGDGPLSVERHQEGHSNETVFVDWGDREFVLRRPPLGATEDSAHDVLREHRVMSALQDTDVPVPPAVLACEDESVIGSEFFLTERLEGDVIREEEPTRFRSVDAREQITDELIDTLIAIHEIDPDAVGLGDFGDPSTYLERQVGVWRQQLEEWLLPKTAEKRELPHVEEIGAWLSENIPEEADHGLVHGDFKLDNVMYGPGTPPELVGVLDWEMSTLGDPLADVGWLLTFWRDEDDPDYGVPEELGVSVTTRAGYPTRAELLETYEQRTGREFVNRRFYRTLNEYKITVACEAMYLRYISGDADDPMYPALEEGVPALARRTKAVYDGELVP
ncbi:MAG: phosphotransferase family protein [Natronomonas sp.]